MNIITTKLQGIMPYLHLKDPLLEISLLQYLVIFCTFYIGRYIALFLLKIILYKWAKDKSLSLVINKIQTAHSYTLSLILLIKVIQHLHLPEQNLIVSNLMFFLYLLCGILIILLAYRIIDALFIHLESRLPEHTKRSIYFLPLLRKVTKIIITLISIILLPRFCVVYDLTSLIGSLSLSLGLVTTAMAFAVKDTMHNLIGGITIVVNRLLKAGDYININGVEGTVLKMELRTTVVKRENGSIVYIPNATFISKNLTNHGNITKKDFVIDFSPDSMHITKLDEFLATFYRLVKEYPGAIEDKCSVKINLTKSNLFSLVFSVALQPISGKKNILSYVDIVKQLKKTALDMNIQDKT